ncbi:MAG: TonB family protein [Breznakibacter sp.]
MMTFVSRYRIWFMVGLGLCFMPIGITAAIPHVSFIAINDSVYDKVDELPYVKNHRKNTMAYLQKNLIYPEKLKLRGLEGSVHVAFTVSKDGKVTNASVSQDAPVEMCEEALRVVMASGPWVPARLSEVPVNSKMTIVLKFVLSDEERRWAEMLKPIDFENKPPLFVLDGKAVEGIIPIEEYNVRSVRIIKGEKALAMYGEKAKHGVVEVTSKRGTPPVW